MIALRPVCQADAAALAAFEVENAAYFERFVPPRPEAHFSKAGQSGLIAELIENADSGSAWCYLIWQGSKLCGRINLTRIAPDCAELGYRVAESASGQGVASKALRRMFTIAARLGLTMLEAEAALSNPASVQVLCKAGFAPNGARRVVQHKNDELVLHRFHCKLPNAAKHM